MKTFMTSSSVWLFIFICIGGFLRFYNLDWGAPFYFHPDERNIAYAIGQMYFPYQLNPHFFAYGGLPMYTTYFLGLINNIITTCNFTVNNCAVTLPQSILILRFFSVIFSIALIPLLYKIGELLHGKSVGLITAFLATTSVGFLQYAHFGTFEMWLTFFTTLLFYLLVRYHNHLTTKHIVWMGVVVGILISVKISSLVLLLPVLLLIIFHPTPHTSWHKRLLISMKQSSLLIFLSIAIFIFTNPFTIFTTKEFLSSISYETQVAAGTLPVFYTGGFYNTLPVIFTITNVYPFILNPLVAILFPILFCYFIYVLIKEKKVLYMYLFLFFLITFLSQSFLFVKWTRYMIPTLPFIYLLISISLHHIFQHIKIAHKHIHAFYRLAFSTLLVVICLVWMTSYVMTVLVAPDTRVVAAAWAKKELASDATIFAEVYDLGIVPFNGIFPGITLYNPYDFDNDPSIYQAFMKSLEDQSVDYIILPSQRLVKTRLQHAETFPQGYNFYYGLLNDKQAYKLIYETPCDIFCRILYMGNTSLFEETTSVFDRPTIRIFKRT